jgi:hypothetical protein
VSNPYYLVTVITFGMISLSKKSLKWCVKHVKSHLHVDPNPFDFGLTIKSHFRYFILFVDVFSSFPVLLGINDQSATTVIRTLQLYCTMFCPTVDRTAAAPLELNLSNLQHIRADAGTQFTSTAFFQSCNDKGIKVSVAAPKHQEQN